MTAATLGSAPDLKTQYSEGGSALRHYSLCVLNLRVVTTAQGLVLLAGSAVLFRDGLFAASGVSSAFGIGVTLALWAVQRSYWICFDSLLKSVVEIEESGGFSGEIIGPWAAYARASKRAYGMVWWKLMVKHVPYVLLWIAFAVILAASIASNSGCGPVLASPVR